MSTSKFTQKFIRSLIKPFRLVVQGFYQRRGRMSFQRVVEEASIEGGIYRAQLDNYAPQIGLSTIKEAVRQPALDVTAQICNFRVGYTSNLGNISPRESTAAQPSVRRSSASCKKNKRAFGHCRNFPRNKPIQAYGVDPPPSHNLVRTEPIWVGIAVQRKKALKYVIVRRLACTRTAMELNAPNWRLVSKHLSRPRNKSLQDAIACQVIVSLAESYF